MKKAAKRGKWHVPIGVLAMVGILVLTTSGVKAANSSHPIWHDPGHQAGMQPNGTSGKTQPQRQTSSKEYVLGNAGGVYSSPGTFQGASTTNVLFEDPAASSVSLTVTDATGHPVFAQIVQEGDLIGSFCGSTTHPIPIDKNAPFVVWLHSGLCLDPKPSIVTSGEVSANFAPLGRALRDFSEPYSATAPGVGFGGDADILSTVVSINIPDATRLSIQVHDRSSSVVKGSIVQGNRVLREFCGETKGQVKFDPRQVVEVWLFNGTCGNGGLSTVTSGFIEISSRGTK